MALKQHTDSIKTKAKACLDVLLALAFMSFSHSKKYITQNNKLHKTFSLIHTSILATWYSWQTLQKTPKYTEHCTPYCDRLHKHHTFNKLTPRNTCSTIQASHAYEGLTHSHLYRRPNTPATPPPQCFCAQTGSTLSTHFTRRVLPNWTWLRFLIPENTSLRTAIQTAYTNKTINTFPTDTLLGTSHPLLHTQREPHLPR